MKPFHLSIRVSDYDTLREQGELTLAASPEMLRLLLATTLPDGKASELSVIQSVNLQKDLSTLGHAALPLHIRNPRCVLHRAFTDIKQEVTLTGFRCDKKNITIKYSK